MKTNGERIVFVDYIRVIACFLVMLVHASENFYGADSSGLAGSFSQLANEANRFWVAFYDGGVSRFCVPLFMVVSAFLLIPLKPQVSMSQFLSSPFQAYLASVHLLFLVVLLFTPVVGRYALGAIVG